MSNNINKTYRIAGMHCAGCASNIERVLSRKEGVNRASVNFAASTVLIDYDPSQISEGQLKEAVENAGFEMDLGQDEDEEESSSPQRREYLRLRRDTIWAGVLTLPVFVIGMFLMHLPYREWIMLAFTIPVLTIFGRGFFINAYKQLKHGSANMDTLVAVSTGVAFIFSLFNTLFPQYWISRGIESHVYYEAVAVIITLILFGRLLEGKAKYSTGEAIRKLMGLRPKQVVLIDDHGAERTVDVREVVVGDIVAVKPGGNIPVDGVVTQGNSFVDESMITGEPMPVEKFEGEQVFAGTINGRGSFRMKAAKVGASTLLAKIIVTVEQAQGSKAPVQKLVDKIAAVFVPVIIALSLLTFAVWMIFGGNGAFAHALLASVTVLVIACPCALGLATPTAVMVGVGKGAQNNILIKDAESLERLCKVTVVALDKTGTLTEGRPVVEDIIRAPGEDCPYFSAILTWIERRSEHPLARAVLEYAGQPEAQVEMSSFRSITGRGVEARLENKLYMVGNRAMMAEGGVSVEGEMKAAADRYSALGSTVLFFSGGSELLAVIAVRDKIKETSADAVAQLRRRGLKVYMLTGDNAASAADIAVRVGVNEYRADMMPHDKPAFVKRLQERGEVVAFASDGINDSGAMAQADVSIAMGQGADIAMEVAQITLMTSDLTYVPKAIRLSAQTVAAIRQNLFWAFIYNIIGIPLAAGVLYPFTGFLLDPMIAATAMAFSSVSVVGNSLRIRYKRL